MTSDEFWALIERTRPPEPDPGLHADELTSVLVAEGVDATVGFVRRFDEAMDALYRWDVWGVGYLLFGGMSDDGFEYFRAWLVGEGRSTWEQVRADPEGYFAALVSAVEASGDELFEVLADRGADAGEALLYAGGTAHEALTGAWSPPADDVGPGRPAEPAGEEWDEGDVESAFPRLAAALAAAEAAGAIGPVPPADGPWSDEEPAAVDAPAIAADLMAVLDAVSEVDRCWERGDHAGVVATLTPLFDRPGLLDRLTGMLPADLVTELVYRGGVGRLQLGDPDGAAAWLDHVVDLEAQPNRVRRALAQIELSRGDLDRAESLLDTAAGAGPWDLALAAAVAGYRRDHEGVRRHAQAASDAVARVGGELHPWDRAGMHVLVGLARVEVGEGSAAMVDADTVAALVAGAPSDLPLIAQGHLVAAGAHRVAGDLAAAEQALDRARPLVRPGTCDLGMVERETARLARAGGRAEEAAAAYTGAVATFTAAGERFLAEATRREAAEPAG